MAGPPPKPAAKRQRRNRRDVGSVEAKALRPVIAGEQPSMPEPPPKMLVATKADWAEFWAGELATLVKPADMPALRRLFILHDERRRYMNAAQKDGRIQLGSTGQLAIHPLLKHISTIDSQITALEDRFGLTPMARLKLGVNFGQAAKTLADLNASVEADASEDHDDDYDPRLEIIDAEVIEDDVSSA